MTVIIARGDLACYVPVLGVASTAAAAAMAEIMRFFIFNVSNKRRQRTCKSVAASRVDYASKLSDIAILYKTLTSFSPRPPPQSKRRFSCLWRCRSRVSTERRWRKFRDFCAHQALTPCRPQFQRHRQGRYRHRLHNHRATPPTNRTLEPPSQRLLATAAVAVEPNLSPDAFSLHVRLPLR